MILEFPEHERSKALDFDERAYEDHATRMRLGFCWYMVPQPDHYGSTAYQFCNHEAEITVAVAELPGPWLPPEAVLMTTTARFCAAHALETLNDPEPFPGERLYVVC